MFEDCFNPCTDRHCRDCPAGVGPRKSFRNSAKDSERHPRFQVSDKRREAGSDQHGRRGRLDLEQSRGVQSLVVCSALNGTNRLNGEGVSYVDAKRERFRGA